MTSKTVEIAGVDEHGNSRGRAQLINGTWWVDLEWDDHKQSHEIVEDIVAAEKLLRDHGASKIFRVERV